MPLSKEERIEIILMAGSGSCRKVAIDFNRKHGKHITHDKIQNMDLKERIRSGITCITPDVLTQVHHEWERRLHVCLQRNGNHVENVL